MEPLVHVPISLPRRGSGARTASLHAQLRAAILDGRLQPGVRLPSSRALAATYRVSRNAVVTAFELLLNEGYIETRHGSGTRVASTLPGAARGARALPAERFTERLNPLWRGATIPAPASAGADALRFTLGAPDRSAFPFDAWRRLSNEVLRRPGAHADTKPHPQGLPELRAAIARHVSYARAVACSADDIVITSGAQQAFALLAHVLATRGRMTVALEDPGYTRVRLAFAAQGARPAYVPVDSEGMVVERVPADARVVCVSPSHQFPLGAVLSAQRRRALLELCERRSTVIIEDDYDGEFRFADRPLDALQTLDASQLVFYVGTFSKCLLPELRLGYIVAPPWARAALVAAKGVFDGGSNALMQAVLARFIAEGHLARHVRRMQRDYARRRERLLAGLAQTCDRWLEPLPSIAGLHLTARLTSHRDEDAVIARARAEGVHVNALRPYYAGEPAMRGLVLGYGVIPEASIDDGLRRLQRALAATATRRRGRHA
jgi:GntR family transcriptional regulator / MocR family aminotransferase